MNSFLIRSVHRAPGFGTIIVGQVTDGAISVGMTAVIDGKKAVVKNVSLAMKGKTAQGDYRWIKQVSASDCAAINLELAQTAIQKQSFWPKLFGAPEINNFTGKTIEFL